MRQAFCTVATIAILAVSGCQQNGPAEVEPDIDESGVETSRAERSAPVPKTSRVQASEDLEFAEREDGIDNLDVQVARLAEAAVLSAKSNDEFDFLVAGNFAALSFTVRAMSVQPDPAPTGQELVEVEAKPEQAAPPAPETLLAAPETGIPSGDANAEAGISDEQDFAAVSSRETIESDALRRRVHRNSRLVYEPDELPEPIVGPNVARFALTTTHDVGTKVYRRFVLANFGWEDRCAEFEDDDAAQREFLSAGGPMRDTMRLDPDGDGFACGWTPEIYRRMLR